MSMMLRENEESSQGTEEMLPQRSAAETSLSQAIFRLQKGYDAEVKNFLCEKQVLSRILKGCVEEFRNCSVEEIAERYIEGDPQISETAVDRDMQGGTPQVPEGRSSVTDTAGLGGASSPDGQGSAEGSSERNSAADLSGRSSAVNFAGAGSRIVGAANEDRSVNEGLVTYDIRFTAMAPGTGEPIQLIINVEAQRRSTGLSYPLVKRGLYYCSRLISAQKNVEFKGTHYENIRKVYSIWICQNVPEDRQHSIVAYDISERIVSSLHPVKPEDRRNYDLMTLVMLGLGDPSVRETDDVLRMLSTALSPDINAEQKKRVMSEEFGIGMTEEMERSVSNMCNLSYDIVEKAEARGKALGEAAGEARGKALGEAVGEARGKALGEAVGEARGKAIGEAHGMTRGKLIQLYELVHDGLLSLSVGADRANQTETEFQAGMDSYYVNAL